MNNQELPPEVQNQIRQLQQLQQQLQALISQKNQVELMQKEAEATFEELEKVDEEAMIYKNVGNLLIKSKKDQVKIDLEEKKETFDMRLKALVRQEERVKKRFDQLQEQLKSNLQGGGSPQAT